MVLSDEERRERDITFLEDPEKWPMWPVCPIKKRGDDYFDTAFVAENGVRLTLYEGNIYAPQDAKPAGVFTAREIIEAGWVVD